MKHPKYDLILAAISGEQMQICKGIEWVDCTQKAAMACLVNGGYEVRIKPKTIRIGDMDVSAPVTEPLEKGQEYFIWTILGGVSQSCWHDDQNDARFLKFRIIHLTEDAALENREAVIKALGGEV